MRAGYPATPRTTEMVVKFYLGNHLNEAEIGGKYPVMIRGKVAGFGEIIGVDKEQMNIQVSIPEYFQPEMRKALACLDVEVEIIYETDLIQQHVHVLFSNQHLTDKQHQYLLSLVGRKQEDLRAPGGSEEDIVCAVNELIEKDINMFALFEILSQAK